MARIFNKIINYILARRRKKLQDILEQLKPKTVSSSATKTHINSSETMILSGETEKILASIDEEIKNIIKKHSIDPNFLLAYIENQGTKVCKMPFAHKVLAFVGEEEGFVPPKKGFKALYLNFITTLIFEKKLNLSFKTVEMFILRNMEINKYFMLHHFHKWYSFKKGLPGYDERSQQLFKRNLNKQTEDKFLNVYDIVLLKEAIARDSQATNFVIQLSKENAGAKNVIQKIQEEGSAEI